MSTPSRIHVACVNPDASGAGVTGLAVAVIWNVRVKSPPGVPRLAVRLRPDAAVYRVEHPQLHR